jgi:hypothetical protein
VGSAGDDAAMSRLPLVACLLMHVLTQVQVAFLCHRR